MSVREELKRNNIGLRGSPGRMIPGRQANRVREKSSWSGHFLPEVYGESCFQGKAALKNPVSVIFTFLPCHSHYSLNGSHSVKK